MRNYYFEQRAPSGGRSLSWDIAHHLFVRQFRGAATIITDKPAILLPAVKKQWQKVIRQARLERSRTLRPSRLAQLEDELLHADHLSFGIFVPGKPPKEDVIFSTLAQLRVLPRPSTTIYLTTTVDSPSQLGHYMLPHGVIVAYVPLLID